MRRIGVVYPGRVEDPTAWSGIPVHVTRAIRDSGFDVEPVSARVPTALEPVLLGPTALSSWVRGRTGLTKRRFGQAWRAARLAGITAPLLSACAARRLRDVDAFVMLGTPFRAPRSKPYVTYEDMTVAQVGQHLWHEWDLVSERAKKRRRRIQQECYDRAVACCVTSTWAAESIVLDYGIDPAKVFVVGIGSRYSVAAIDREWTTPRFLFVGMNWERKNGDAVVRAFREVRLEHPDAELHLVGEHPAIDEPGVVEHGVLRLDDASAAERLARLYASATCYVMPSVREPSAMVYLEAAAYGVPSIGTTSGGSAELIGDGGLVVDPHDPVALTAAMLDLCNPETAKSLGVKAQDAVQTAGWSDVAERLLGALSLAEYSHAGLVSIEQDADLELAPLLPYVPNLATKG